MRANGFENFLVLEEKVEIVTNMKKNDKQIHCLYPGCKRTHLENKKYMLCPLHNRLRIKNESKNKTNILEVATIKGTVGTTSRCIVLGCIKPVYSRSKCITHIRQELNAFRKAQQKENPIEVTTLDKTPIESKKNDSTSIKSKSGKIAQVSKKNASTKVKMTEMKKEAKSIDQACEGCLSYKGVLDYSHILSVGQRKDLELDPNNKNMLCRECHQKWESWDPDKMITLACFYSNMRFIFTKDNPTFWRVYFKFNDALNFKVCKELENIENELKTQQNG